MNFRLILVFAFTGAVNAAAQVPVPSYTDRILHGCKITAQNVIRSHTDDGTPLEYISIPTHDPEGGIYLGLDDGTSYTSFSLTYMGPYRKDRVAGSIYTVQNEATGQCIGFDGDLRALQCAPDTSSQWLVTYFYPSGYSVRYIPDARYGWDIYEGRVSAGTPLIKYKNNNNENQVFHFENCVNQYGYHAWPYGFG